MFKTDFCEVKYLKELDAAFCYWKNFCKGDNYRDPLLYGLNLLKEKNCKTWITDTRDGFENKKEDSEWLVNVFIPQTISSSCKNIFFIMKSDSPLKNEIEAQTKALSEYFNVNICKNLRLVKEKLLNDM